MRLIYTLFTLAVGGYGLFWIAEKNPQLKHKAEELMEFRTTNALEIRYDAAQVMDTYQKTLLKEKGAHFLQSELKFFPFLLMEVKYCDAKNKTRESMILWDLTEGEMILDTSTWEKTHGFADCILSNAKEYEFKILHHLSQNGGSSDLSSLQKKLAVEPPVLEVMLKTCVKKNLILPSGNESFRLHLENPHLTSIPETRMHEQLTTRPHKGAQKASAHFSAAQIEKIAKMSFGESFAIRTTTQIYLPIHRIVVQNPDGAMQTSHFNALNGKELPPAHFYQ